MRSSPAAVAIRLVQTVGGMLAIGLLWWTAGRRLDGWLGWVVDVAFWTYVVLRPLSVPLSWLTTTWDIDERAVRRTSGWVLREQTVVGWDEVVAVDVSQPYLHRLLGCWAVRFALGTTQRSALRIDAVSRAQRDVLLALARPAGTRAPTTTGTTPASGGTEVYRIRPSDYLLISVTYGQFVLFVPAVLSVLDQVGDWLPLRLPDPGVFLAWPWWQQLAGALGVLAASVAYGWGYAWLRYRGFRVVREDDAYVTRGGLLSAETRTVAVRRVIGLTVTQNPLMRALGYGRVTVLTADAGDQPLANLLFPVVRLADLPATLGAELSVDPEVVTPTLRLGRTARLCLGAGGLLLASALVAVAYAVRPGALLVSGTVVVLAVALWVNARWVVATTRPGRSRCYARRGVFWVRHVELDLAAVHVVETSQGPLGRLTRTWTVAVHYYDGRVRCLRAVGCDPARRGELVATATG